MARFSTAVLAGVVGVCVAPALAIGVRAQGLVTTQKLSAPLANELVGDAVASCAQKGYAVTAAVVDLDGIRQAILRGDGAPIHTLDNAYYKAYSAASLTLARKEDSTKAVADRMSKPPRVRCRKPSCPTLLMQSAGWPSWLVTRRSPVLALAVLRVATLMKNVREPPSPRSKIG